MITIVHGAPCSGKTTYVQEHIKPNDLVFDWDAIEYAISGNEYQKKNPNLSSLVRKIRTAVVDECLTNANIEDKWLVATTLSQGLIELLQTADELTIKEMETPKEVCLERLNKTNRDDKEGLEQAINRWFVRYDEMW